MLHPGAGANLDAHARQIAVRPVGQRFRIGCEDAGAGIHQDDPRRSGIDAAELRLERGPRHGRQRACHLDPGRSRPDQHERQKILLTARIALDLGELEQLQDSVAHRQHVGDRLRIRRDLRPLIVPKVTPGGAGRQDQEVVTNGPDAEPGLVHGDGALLWIHAEDFGHLDHRVLLAAQQMADGGGDLDSGEDAGGDLIQQWLKQMMVRPIEEGDPHGRSFERACGSEAAESAADDDDVRWGFDRQDSRARDRLLRGCGVTGRP